VKWCNRLFNKIVPIFCISTALLLLLLIAACSSATSEKVKKAGQVKIGYGAPLLASGQAEIMQGLIKKAEQKGWTVITTNADSDSERQANQIDYFMSMEVDAIVVVPVDSQAICAPARKAMSAGIPFYTIDRAPVGCQINMTVLSDNFMAGKQAGEAMIDLLSKRYGNARGTVLELQGDLGTNVAVLRGNGFHSVINKYSEVEVISKPTEWRAEKFASATVDVVSSKEIDGIYLQSDCVGMSVVISALEQLGKKFPRDDRRHILITSVDGCPEGLKAIREGYADAAANQPLPDFGIIVDWIEKELKREPIEPGEVVMQGAPWSPAKVTREQSGWQLLLATTRITPENINDSSLWGNSHNPESPTPLKVNP